MVSLMWRCCGRVLTGFAVAPRLGLAVNQDAVNSVTRGLIGDTSFAVLPDITPFVTFILTLGFQIVSGQFSPAHGHMLTVPLALPHQTLCEAYL